ncbi:hypothetical protein [Spirosoma flavum]|uniref:DUF5683 domain-containing protein n=1 Tax=Spirosoma flavum TaxID=2048557 RepID=A0ABW6ADJ0_9BACT
MRLLLAFFICLVAVLSGQAQERLRNVRIRVVDSSQLEIRYDLVNVRPGDSVYVEVRSRLRGALRILPEFVRGDIGNRLTAGSDRRIVWNALENGYSLNEEVQAKVLLRTGLPVSPQPIPAEPAIVQKPATPPIATTPTAEVVPPKATRSEPVVVTEQKPIVPPVEPTLRQEKNKRAKPSIFAVDSSTSQLAPPVVSAPAPQPTTTRTEPTVKPVDPSLATADPVKPRKTHYAGPAWALLSVVAPGIGNIFVQMPKPKVGLRPLLTVGCYGLLVYGFMERQKSQDDYSSYEQQKNMAAGEPYYQTANDHHHRYFLATRGAIVVAAADVILTFIKGVHNSQLQKEARRYQSLTLRPGLQAGQPTAVVRYSF